MTRYIANADYADFGASNRNAYPGSTMIGGSVGFIKDLFQGACSGAMTFIGMLNTVGAELAIMPHLPIENFVDKTLTSIASEEFAMSPYVGPVEIAIGAALFLTARRGMARTIGLLGVIFYIVAVATGVDLSQFSGIAGNLAESAQAGWNHFQTLQQAATP